MFVYRVIVGQKFLSCETELYFDRVILSHRCSSAKPMPCTADFILVFNFNYVISFEK